jgi:isocitrate/isopropylmalate dehydrogenase
MAHALEQAVAGVIEAGRVRTYDLGGDSSTMDVARAVADQL